MTTHNEHIEHIRKRFKREWLLIEVQRFDRRTTQPISGRLLAHSKDRDAIFRRSLNDRRHLLILSSDDTLPKGFAAAFHA